MRTLRAWLIRFGGLFQRERRERELAEELEGNLQFHIEDNLRAGMPAEEARRQALMRLGGLEQAKEGYRDRRGLPWLESLLQDLRYGMRTLRKAPGFTAVAVLTLALGIAANSAIFSTISGILLRKPTIHDPDRVLMLLSVSRARGMQDDPEQPVSAPDFISWREQSRSFSGLAAMDTFHNFTLTGGGSPEEILGMRVSANYFQVLGVKAALGRTFVADEDQPGRGHVVVLSHGLWERRFAADPAIVGRTVEIDGQPTSVIGVMPASFNLWIFGAQAWTPLAFTPQELGSEGRKARFYFVVGRLAAGLTPQRAQAEMDTIARRLGRDFTADKGWDTKLLSLQEFEVQAAQVRPALLLLMAAVAFVLLVVCANIAGLLIARGSARQQEIAIRTALGARRVRLLRQLLAENLLICVIGTGLGLGLASGAIRLLRAALSFNEVVAGMSFGLDRQVLVFTAALAGASLLAFGLAPALQLSGPSLQSALRESSRTGSAGRSRMRLRQVLVVGEIAVSLVLLMGAGLMIKIFLQKVRGDHGFNPRQVLTAEIALTRRRYSAPKKQAEFFQQLIERVRTLSGIESAGAASNLPMGSGNDARPLQIEGRFVPESEWPRAGHYVVTPGYFGVMQIPIVQGRTFSRSDDAQAPPVAVVNRELARRFFPAGNAVGQHISVSNNDAGRPVWREIVGVVGDVDDDWVGQTGSRPQVYDCYLQFPAASMAVAVRSATPVNVLAPELRQTVWSVDKDQPVSQVMTMEGVMYSHGGGAGSQLISELLGLFAAMALLLAAIGIYGVISYVVIQRTHEIGIRVALGAAKHDILHLVLSEGLRLAALGVLMGALGAAAVPRALAAVFMGLLVSPWLVWMVAVSTIVALALGACYLPARRAARVDPMVALRYE